METTNGLNFDLLNFGGESTIKKQATEVPTVGKFEGKVFLKQILNLTGTEISLNVLGPGVEVPFKHRHKKNEELYYFIKGQGEFEIDDSRLPISSGTIIRVSPQGVRKWRNTGKEDLFYMVVQSRANTMEIATIEDGELVAG